MVAPDPTTESFPRAHEARSGATYAAQEDRKVGLATTTQSATIRTEAKATDPLIWYLRFDCDSALRFQPTVCSVAGALAARIVITVYARHDGMGTDMIDASIHIVDMPDCQYR